MQRPDIFAVMNGQVRPTDETDQAEETAPPHKNLYATLNLATDKAAALLVAMHAYDERGTSGDGQKAMKELEEKYVRVTNETIRALQAALAATSMELDEDPDHYITRATRLWSILAAVNEPVTDHHCAYNIVQGLPDSYRDIKLTTYKGPDFDLSKIETTMSHLYLGHLSREKT